MAFKNTQSYEEGDWDLWMIFSAGIWRIYLFICLIPINSATRVREDLRIQAEERPQKIVEDIKRQANASAKILMEKYIEKSESYRGRF